MIGFSTVPKLSQTSLCLRCCFYCPRDNGTSLVLSTDVSSCVLWYIRTYVCVAYLHHVRSCSKILSWVQFHLSLCSLSYCYYVSILTERIAHLGFPSIERLIAHLAAITIALLKQVVVTFSSFLSLFLSDIKYIWPVEDSTIMCQDNLKWNR